MIRITHAGVSVEATDDTWQAAADELVRLHGPWNAANGSRIERVEVMAPPSPAPISIPAAVAQAGAGAPEPTVVVHPGDRPVPVSQTRLERERRAFDNRATVREELARGVAIVQAEKRRDVKLTAGEVAKGLTMNGALKWNGLKMREQSIRGLLARLDSPALRYVLGVRDRITDPDATEVGRTMDREAILDVIHRECRRFPERPLMFRTREGLGDVFTTVSQDYTVADFDRQARMIGEELPQDAKAFFRYDATTTRWELQASTWTPTPTHEAKVGEPFRAYTSLKGGDAGLTSIVIGGGLEILICLNGMTTTENGANGSRAHRGDQMFRDLRRLIRGASRAIEALVTGWGNARAETIERPTDTTGRLIPLEEAIPGFYRSMLTRRQGVLVGRLPGRTEPHVKALALTYDHERRNPQDVTRADLAQGYTRYIQDQPTPVRLDAESAIGRWIVSPAGEPVSYVRA